MTGLLRHLTNVAVTRRISAIHRTAALVHRASLTCAWLVRTEEFMYTRRRLLRHGITLCACMYLPLRCPCREDTPPQHTSMVLLFICVRACVDTHRRAVDFELFEAIALPSGMRTASVASCACEIY